VKKKKCFKTLKLGVNLIWTSRLVFGKTFRPGLKFVGNGKDPGLREEHFSSATPRTNAE
jgi:hypothetical protein